MNRMANSLDPDQTVDRGSNLLQVFTICLRDLVDSSCPNDKGFMVQPLDQNKRVCNDTAGITVNI